MTPRSHLLGNKKASAGNNRAGSGKTSSTRNQLAGNLPLFRSDFLFHLHPVAPQLWIQLVSGYWFLENLKGPGVRLDYFVEFQYRMSASQLLNPAGNIDVGVAKGTLIAWGWAGFATNANNAGGNINCSTVVAGAQLTITPMSVLPTVSP